MVFELIMAIVSIIFIIIATIFGIKFIINEEKFYDNASKEEIKEYEDKKFKSLLISYLIFKR